MSGLRFIHLIVDSPFADAAMRLFDELTPRNRYLFSSDKPRITLKHIADPGRVELFACARRELETTLLDGDAYDVLVLHSLTVIDPRLLPAIPERVRVWWLSWGHDIYRPSLIDTPLLLDRTAALHRELARGGRSFFKKDDLRDLFSILFHHRHPLAVIRERIGKRLALRNESAGARNAREKALLENAVRRVNYCSTVLPEEFDLLAAKPFFLARRLPFSYGLDRDLYPADAVATAPLRDGPHILIGNSATYENNHADAFDILRTVTLPPGSDLIAPLNYGDDAYAREITRLGGECFGTRFRPIRELLPFPRYADLLRSCSAAIFYHERQQGFGTVALALWNGLKVFLSKNSLLYTHLKKQGFLVLSVQDDLNAEELATPLPRDTVIAQRSLLAEHYSRAALRKRLRESVEEIERGSNAVQ